MEGRAERSTQLQGWVQIERYLGLTRNTILARGYPVRKDGGVFAFREELDTHAKSRPSKSIVDNVSH